MRGRKVPMNLTGLVLNIYISNIKFHSSKCYLFIFFSIYNKTKTFPSTQRLTSCVVPSKPLQLSFSAYESVVSWPGDWLPPRGVGCAPLSGRLSISLSPGSRNWPLRISAPPIRSLRSKKFLLIPTLFKPPLQVCPGKN